MQSIIERLKTWEDFAAEAGIHPVESLPFKHDFKTPRQEATNAFFQLDVIAGVLREKVVLNWKDSNQRKWYCWFHNYKKGSGFSFIDARYGWAGTRTHGGARLCVDTEEKAEYFGNQFLDIWNKFLNPNQ